MRIISTAVNSVLASVAGRALSAYEARSLGTEAEKAFGLLSLPNTASGEPISERTALNLSAVWACVQVLSGSVAVLSWPVYRRLEGSGREVAPAHEVYRVLHERANPEMSGSDFRQTMMVHLLLWGNAYAEIERNNRGRVVALWPITPDRVRLRRENQGLGSGPLVYDVWGDADSARREIGKKTTLSARDVFHVKGISNNGIQGLSVIGHARESLGLGRAAEMYGARFFGNDASPRGFLKHPGDLSAQARQNILESWRAAYGGKNRHKVAMLDEGMTYERLGIPPEDAQFLETRQFQTSEVCRWFNMKPHMIADLERATFSNIEHQAIEYAKMTLLPWLRKFEDEAHYKLFPPGERRTYYTELQVESLLRADIKTRHESYKIAIDSGWMNRDEVRQRENMNPLPDGLGEVFTVPLNMGAAQTVMGDAAAEAEKQDLPGEPSNDPGVTPGSVDERGAAVGAEDAAAFPGETRAADEELVDPDHVAKVMMPVLTDAAFRHWDRATKAIAAKAKKTGPDDLRSWLAEWAEGHADWARVQLTPSAVAAARMLGMADPESRGAEIAREVVSADLARMCEAGAAIADHRDEERTARHALALLASTAKDEQQPATETDQ